MWRPWERHAGVAPISSLGGRPEVRSEARAGVRQENQARNARTSHRTRRQVSESRALTLWCVCVGSHPACRAYASQCPVVAVAPMQRRFRSIRAPFARSFRADRPPLRQTLERSSRAAPQRILRARFGGPSERRSRSNASSGARAAVVDHLENGWRRSDGRSICGRRCTRGRAAQMVGAPKGS